MKRRPVHSPRPVRTALAVAALLGASTLSGCAAFSDDSQDPSGAGSGSGGSGAKVSVVTAFYPLQYAVQQVGGSRVSVSNLTKPGAEPHDLEITPAQTAQVVDADLVVYESGFQPAVDDAVAQDAQGTRLDAGDVVGLEAPGHGGHDHGAEDTSHEEESHAHGNLDPHFWQDPTRMAKLADAVARDLAKIDPDHASDYRSGAAAFRTKLSALDRDYRQGLADCTRDTVVVSHDAFGYLAERYGLTMEPIAGLSPGAEPTPADLARLEDLIRRDGITTVFSERLVSPRLSASLAQDSGVRTAVLDPIEGLSDQTSGEDYLTIMRSNLAALQKANGCS